MSCCINIALRGDHARGWECLCLDQSSLQLLFDFLKSTGEGFEVHSID